LPILIFNFLVLFRISPFLPIIKHLYPDPLLFFFMFFGIFFFLRIKMTSYFNFVKKLLPFVLILVAIIFVLVSAMYTPWFPEYHESDEEVIELLELVDGIFIITPNSYGSYSRAIYSYGPIYNNLSTANGWIPMYVSQEYLDFLESIDEGVREEDCETIYLGLDYLNVTNVIGYGSYCEVLNSCQLEDVETLEYTCLYKFNS
jgi:hypothetical protein